MSENKKSLSARQYLSQLEVIETKINQKLEQLDTMKSNAIGAGGMNYSRERVQTSMVGNRLCNDVTRYVAFDNEINAEIDRFIDAKNQIINEIQGLNVNNYIQVLFKIYVQFKTVKTTSCEMDISYRYTIDLHKKALKAFEDAYENLHYLT